MTPKFISILGCGLLFAVNAAAQGEAAPTAAAPVAPAAEAPAAEAPAAEAPAPAAPAEAAPVEVPPTAEAAPADEAPKADEEDDMGGILIGLKLGLLLTGGADVKINNVSVTTPSRTDFQLTVPLNFGGAGFGFDLQPSIGFGDVTALGLYLGPAYHLGLKKNLYINFGVGPQIRYWLSAKAAKFGTVDLGADIQARIPVGVTYYAQPDLGLFAEIGLAFGATGFKSKAPVGAPPGAGDFHLGTGMAFDFGIGVRYP